MVLGLTGTTVKTTDPEAGFRLHFNGRVHAGPQVLTLLFLSSESAFDLVLDIDGIRRTYTSAGHEDNELRIPLDAEPSVIEVHFEKHGLLQNSFEFYGLSLASTAPGSITVHHAGMIGQRLSHVLSESLFRQQIRSLDPRLVVLDLEANEYYKHGLNINEYQVNMVNLIMNLRRSLPEVEILLLSSMDVKRSGLYLEDGRRFSEQVRIMSHTQNCIFWDWYWVAGGPYSIEKWADKGLATKWLTSLNEKGRTLQSQALSDAFFRNYDMLSTGQKPRSNIYNIDTIKLSRKLVSPELPRDSTNERWQYHTVKHGQTLYGVAAMYGVTMDQVMQWNQLISRVLYVGQVLKIESNHKPVATPPHSPTIKPKPKVVPVVYHSVKRGETLFSIAKKYGTSTTAIMRLNGLRSTRLGIGQRLRVR
jgi:LysM repeat protein